MIPPDEGSRILFFSGGTALAPVAAELSRHTRNAVHVITTFDSGGSSAELRRAFDMPAVGDIRARIMALADRSLEGNSETVELLGYRLPKDAGPEALHRELASLASGAHPLVAAIPEPMNEVVTQHLSAFRSLMPVDIPAIFPSIVSLSPWCGCFPAWCRRGALSCPWRIPAPTCACGLRTARSSWDSTASPARPRPPSPHPYLICGFQPLWMILLPFPCLSSRALPTSSGLRILFAILWAVSFLP